MQFAILGENTITGENNYNDDMSKIAHKLEEEFLELKVEIQDKNFIRATSEAYDLIQTIIRFLIYVDEYENIDLEEENINHNLKLISRGWQFESIINIK